MAPGAGAVVGVHCGVLPEWGRQRKDGAELKAEERGEGLKGAVSGGSCRASFGERKGNLSMYHKLRVYSVHH